MEPKFQGIFISQKMTLLPEGGDDKQSPLTCVAIAAGKKAWNQLFISEIEFRGHVHTHPNHLQLPELTYQLSTCAKLDSGRLE